MGFCVIEMLLPDLDIYAALSWPKRLGQATTVFFCSILT